jgi:hypothetical protein
MKSKLLIKIFVSPFYYESDRHEWRRRPSFGRFCVSTVTRPREPISFRKLVYKVFSYFKREADAICVCVYCISAPPAIVRVGQYTQQLKPSLSLGLPGKLFCQIFFKLFQHLVWLLGRGSQPVARPLPTPWWEKKDVTKRRTKIELNCAWSQLWS